MKRGWVKEEETLKRESEHVPPSMCDVFADGIKENPAAPHHFSPEISDWPHIIVPTELLSFPSDKVNVPRRFLLFTDIPERGRRKKNTTSTHSEIYCPN